MAVISILFVNITSLFFHIKGKLAVWPGTLLKREHYEKPDFWSKTNLIHAKKLL